MATKSVHVARSLLMDCPDYHLNEASHDGHAMLSNVLLSIKAKAAADVSNCSAYPDHAEVLFRKDTIFEVSVCLFLCLSASVYGAVAVAVMEDCMRCPLTGRHRRLLEGGRLECLNISSAQRHRALGGIMGTPTASFPLCSGGARLHCT